MLGCSSLGVRGHAPLDALKCILRQSVLVSGTYPGFAHCGFWRVAKIYNHAHNYMKLCLYWQLVHGITAAMVVALADSRSLTD